MDGINDDDDDIAMDHDIRSFEQEQEGYEGEGEEDTQTEIKSYKDVVNFDRLSYTELKMSFTPNERTLKRCIGRRGANLIRITRLSGLAWIYWKADRQIFELYGDDEAEVFENAAENIRAEKANFLSAKAMLLDSMAFSVLRERSAPAAHKTWASEHLRALPVSLPNFQIRNVEKPHQVLSVPEPALAYIDACLRTSDHLPIGSTVRYDVANCTVAYITRLPSSAYDIRASDDHALHTATVLIQKMLVRYYSVCCNPVETSHLFPWVMAYTKSYGV